MIGSRSLKDGGWWGFDPAEVQRLASAGRGLDGASLERVSVEMQGHRVSVRVEGLPQRGGGVRGRVRGFSRSSRKRLLDLLAGLDPVQLAGFRYVGLFVTLTYAGDEGELPGPEKVKRDLDVFLKRVGRRFPGVSGVWRFEWESDGAREYHPHLHLILLGVGFWHWGEVRRVWNEVSGNPAGSPSTDVTGLRSWRGVIYYAAKYVAKGQGVSDEGAEGASLVYHSYFPGRVWGVFNRDGLPEGKQELIVMKGGIGGWFYDFRRLARRRWSGVNDGRYQGFTLYVDDPSEWVRALYWCLVNG